MLLGACACKRWGRGVADDHDGMIGLLAAFGAPGSTRLPQAPPPLRGREGEAACDCVGGEG